MKRFIFTALAATSVLLANDDLSLSLEDSLAEEGLEESLSIEEPVTAQSLYPKVDFSHQYRFALGEHRLYREGIASGITSERENDSVLINEYEVKAKVTISQNLSYLLRLRTALVQKNNKEDNEYEDESSLQLREGYAKFDSSGKTTKLGLFIPKNGLLDVDSVSNVLTQKNSAAINSFRFDDSKTPIIGLQYKAFSEDSTFGIITTPMKPKNEGTEYTEFLKTTDSNANDDGTTELAPYFGLQYKKSFQHVDMGLSAFSWFDVDNKISWSDTSSSTSVSTTNSTSFSDTYKERASSVQFISTQADTNLGEINIKTELAYFKDKNIYHFFKDNSGAKDFNTYEADMFASAISFEKKWESFFLMGVLSYKHLYDVPAQTNILMFENRSALAPNVRDLYQSKYSIVSSYEFNTDFKVSASWSQSFPVNQYSISNAWEYALSKKHKLAMKYLYSDSEKQMSTGSSITAKDAFIEYRYIF